MKGEFEFKYVKFNYPANPNIGVLKSVSFKIEPNKKTAIIGESGSGKSTCMQLIERFYDIQEGFLTLDGKMLN